MKIKKQLHIVLIEDDEIDAMTFKRAMQNLGIDKPLHVISSCSEALELLEKELIPKPYVIVLDLNVPGLNGIEFLKAIRSTENSQFASVVVLTTSSQEKDKSDAYLYHVSGYFIKQLKYDDFIKQLSIINNYWDMCEFPN